jgi:hypothetical protein
MYKKFTPNKATLKAQYCAKVEKMILEIKPELRGKFTALLIWQDIEYLYSKNFTECACVGKILQGLK